MITIICANGLIDATGCHIHIREGGTAPGPVQGFDRELPYCLKLTHLVTKKDLDVSEFSDKESAENVLIHIISAIKKGKRYVDIRDIEKWKSELGSS